MPSPYLDPAADGQRNAITAALMNIAAPQPQTPMPPTPQMPMQQPMPMQGAPQGVPQGAPIGGAMPPPQMPQAPMPQAPMGGAPMGGMQQPQQPLMPPQPQPGAQG